MPFPVRQHAWMGDPFISSPAIPEAGVGISVGHPIATTVEVYSLYRVLKRRAFEILPAQLRREGFLHWRHRIIHDKEIIHRNRFLFNYEFLRFDDDWGMNLVLR